MKIIYNNIRSYTKFCKKGSVSMEEKKNEIILFENQGVKLEVNLKKMSNFAPDLYNSHKVKLY